MDRHSGPMQAVIRDALNAKQSDIDTWPRISPAEAAAIRQSYYAAEDEIKRLRDYVTEIETAASKRA